MSRNNCPHFNFKVASTQVVHELSVSDGTSLLYDPSLLQYLRDSLMEGLSLALLFIIGRVGNLCLGRKWVIFTTLKRPFGSRLVD